MTFVGGKKIVLTGGGTAGHVTPNIALLPALREAGYEVAYVGSEDGIERELIRDYGIPYVGVPTGKLRRYFDWKNFTDPFRVLRGFARARTFLKGYRPDVVFSKGGFVSVPVVRAAASLGIPCIIHESDMTPGLANRLCYGAAQKVCCNFPETLGKVPREKGVLTGTPIREELFSGSREEGLRLCGFGGDDAPFGMADATGGDDAPFGMADATGGDAAPPFGMADATGGDAAPFGMADATGGILGRDSRSAACLSPKPTGKTLVPEQAGGRDKPVLLVMGGSQGAASVNEAVRRHLPELLDTFWVIHLCGTGKRDDSLGQVAGYAQFEYVKEDLRHLFAAADIIVSRAGANAIFEILALQKPNLLIPLSSGTRGDQILNARSFASQGFSEVLVESEENGVLDKKLVPALRSLYAGRDAYVSAMAGAGQQDAIPRIMELLDQAARGGQG